MSLDGYPAKLSAGRLPAVPSGPAPGAGNRERVVSVRLDDVEEDLLDQLVGLYGMPRSAVVRQLIRTAPLWSIRMAEHAAAQGAACTCCKVHGGRAP